jgi:hypothetical protein
VGPGRIGDMIVSFHGHSHGEGVLALEHCNLIGSGDMQTCHAGWYQDQGSI